MNKSGLDKQIVKKVQDITGIDIGIILANYDLVGDKNAMLEHYLSTVIAQAVQEAHQQGVSDTLGKVRSIKNMVDGVWRLRKDEPDSINRVDKDLLTISNNLHDLLSALDHLEEGK